jgi:hypothetical protein
MLFFISSVLYSAVVKAGRTLKHNVNKACSINVVLFSLFELQDYREIIADRVYITLYEK